MSNTTIRKILKRVTVVFSITLFICIACFKFIDFSPLDEQEYYKSSKKTLKNVNLHNTDTSQVKAGWSKANITPNFPAKIIGFGKNTNFSGVMDSIFVRSIVFEQSHKKYLYLSYDLMIIHPYLVKELEKEIKKENIELEGIYYTATHTHNSIGGFADKISGKIALGGLDDKVVDLLVSKTLESIKRSTSKLSPVSYDYGTNDNTDNLLINRLNKVNGKIDGNLRLLSLKNKEGKQLALSTFSAHATCLKRKLDSISADYPGTIVKRLDDIEKIDFSIFSAGSVGSHAPSLTTFTKKSKNEYAERVLWRAIKILETENYKPLKNISFSTTALSLREPHLKIWKNIVLRPWLFKLIMGEANAKLNFLKLNDLVFVGTPCDFSGELTLEIEAELENKNITPIITSFNGEYIGYITPDKYYMWDTHEVRDVNWFGPYNGRYFKESILQVLNNIE